MTKLDEPQRQPHDTIQVRGARTQNLKNVDVDIPRGKFVVISGPSGSGKSSFVIDTIFAEGRRRFLETLSFSARQIAGQLARPDVDSVTGLPPTVALGTASGRPTRLSTFSTLTKVDDSLRLLFARVGQAHCPSCGEALSTRSVDDIVRGVLRLPERTKLVIHAPLAQAEKGDHHELLAQVVRDGFVRVRVDGSTYDAADVPQLDESKPHTIDAIVDRLIVKSGFEERLRESLDLAIEHGRGSCIVTRLDTDRNEHDRLESTRFACVACDVSYPDLDPRALSFESPYGACDNCRGTGEEGDQQCSSCDGDRVQPFARRVLLAERSLPDIRRCRPEELMSWFREVEAALRHDPIAAAIVAKVSVPITRRLDVIAKLGLDYISLDRIGRSLSGGELQRSRLVNGLASGLTGVCYVLDEPTSGLHHRETKSLLDVLQTLANKRSTVLAIEHDPTVIRHADQLLMFGPTGGDAGGILQYTGSPDQCTIETPASQSATRIERNANNAALASSLVVRNAKLRNLNNVTVSIPLEKLVGIAGVSGSGKTTFARDVLAAGLRRLLAGEAVDAALVGSFEGYDAFDAVSVLDQTAAGRSPRSCPATVLGIWSSIRQVLAKTKVARLRGYDSKRFSFNNPEGQCPHCRGQGRVRVQVKFLPPTSVCCVVCDGKRFEPTTLSVAFKGYSAGQILNATIDESLNLFGNLSRIAKPLQLASDIGLGYLKLGQPSDTLSGGESQRLKLIQVLTKNSAPKNLFVLDEPTAGLSFREVPRLAAIFRRLVGAGHTVVCIEHNLQLLSECDHVIEFGPGAGPNGGHVVASGTLCELAGQADSPTGKAFSETMQSRVVVT